MACVSEACSTEDRRPIERLLVFFAPEESMTLSDEGKLFDACIRPLWTIARVREARSVEGHRSVGRLPIFFFAHEACKTFPENGAFRGLRYPLSARDTLWTNSSCS